MIHRTSQGIFNCLVNIVSCDVKFGSLLKGNKTKQELKVDYNTHNSLHCTGIHTGDYSTYLVVHFNVTKMGLQ
jgi:hypothetical protein